MARKGKRGKRHGHKGNPALVTLKGERAYGRGVRQAQFRSEKALERELRFGGPGRELGLGHTELRSGSGMPRVLAASDLPTLSFAPTEPGGPAGRKGGRLKGLLTGRGVADWARGACARVWAATISRC